MSDKRLMEQIFNLRFTSKQLQRASKKAEKDEKAERLKVKKVREAASRSLHRTRASSDACWLMCRVPC